LLGFCQLFKHKARSISHKLENYISITVKQEEIEYKNIPIFGKNPGFLSKKKR